MPTASQVQALPTVPFYPTSNVGKGDVVTIGALTGIAQKDVAANQVGNLIVNPLSVQSLPKATGGGTGAALKFGTIAYWDAVNKIASASPSVGPRIGITVSQVPADADTNVYVLLDPTHPILPAAKFNTTALSNATLTAGLLTGAAYVSLTTTANGANALTTRTATQMFADTPGAQVGQSYRLRITNTGDNTVTLTAGAGVTIVGTATIPTNTTRDFVVTFNTPTTLTIQTDGTGTIS